MGCVAVPKEPSPLRAGKPGLCRHGHADAAPAALGEPLPLLGMAVMEIKPSCLSCPTVSLSGAKDSGYLLIAQWLLQLEFRQADPPGPCSAGRAPHTWLQPVSCCAPAWPWGQASAAGPLQHAELGPSLLPRWMCPCPQSPSGIPPANQPWRAPLRLGSY